MEKVIFDLLVEISNKGLIQIEDSGIINSDQRILDKERDRQLKYLLSEGLISSSGNDTYIITEFGYEVSKHEDWIKYLKFHKEVRDRKIKKENIDLKISEFQVRTKFLPYYISAISIIISLVALTDPFQRKEDENNFRKIEPVIRNTLIDTVSANNKNILDTLQHNPSILK